MAADQKVLGGSGLMNNRGNSLCVVCWNHLAHARMRCLSRAASRTFGVAKLLSDRLVMFGKRLFAYNKLAGVVVDVMMSQTARYQSRIQ